jgi:hypothetical protein
MRNVGMLLRFGWLLLLMVMMIIPSEAAADPHDWEYIGMRPKYTNFEYVNIVKKKLSSETASEVCADSGCDAVDHSECPPLNNTAFYGNNFFACCECFTWVEVYPGEKYEIYLFEADPGMSFGVEEALFKTLDPTNAWSHNEVCISSYGGMCSYFWGQRAGLQVMVEKLVDDNTPTAIGGLLRWFGNGFDKKAVQCDVVTETEWEIAAGVRNHGGYKIYGGTPRSNPVAVFENPYLSPTDKTSYEMISSGHYGIQYDYASLTTYDTLGWHPGWGGCAAAMDSAWGLSTIEGHRATNKSSSEMCYLVYEMLDIIPDKLLNGVIHGFDGIDLDDVCDGMDDIDHAIRLSNAFLNGSFAAEYKGYTTPKHYLGGCQYWIGDVDFVTSPADLFHNLSGTSPRPYDYTDPFNPQALDNDPDWGPCSSSHDSYCESRGGQCLKRDGQSACWYPMTDRGGSCPGTYEQPYANPAISKYFFTDKNAKCLEMLTGNGCNGESHCGWGYCCTSNPCENGEGDCDSDAECSGDLICGNDIGISYGCSYYVDICIESGGGGY